MTQRLLAAAAIVAAISTAGYLAHGCLFEEPQATAGARPGPPKPESSGMDQVVVRSVRGVVERERAGEEMLRLEEGNQLSNEDTVHTKEGSEATLNAGSVATVQIAERSSLTVAEISRRLSRMRLGEGLIAATAHGRENSRLRVEVRGTDAVAESGKARFVVLSSGTGQVTVGTEEGSVRFSAKGKAVEIGAGEQSVVWPGLPPSEPQKIPPSLFLKVRPPDAVAQRSKSTTVRGWTVPGAVVSIDDKRIGVDARGTFNATVRLREGRNRIRVLVEDAARRQKVETLPTVTVDSRAPPVKGEVSW